MKERPILFSAPMVRAILNGSKTQTRRVVKPQPHGGVQHGVIGPLNGFWNLLVCRLGQVGDLLWVRETWQAACGDKRAARIVESPRPDFGWIEYAATCDDPPPRWRPSIHMPRWASRILLEITGIRVERLQDISQEDAIAEGAPRSHPSIDKVSREFGYEDFSRSWYGQLWESINGAGSWEANPWVWVIEFRRIKP